MQVTIGSGPRPGPIVQAILRHAARCEVDPGFLAAESVAYKCGVLSTVPERFKDRVWRHLCEDSTSDYTVALVIARCARQRAGYVHVTPPRAPLLLALRECSGFPLLAELSR